MKIKKLLFIAATLYLLIAPFTYHTDTKLNLAYPSLGGGVWNIYGYLEKNKLDIPPLHYPPLHYAALRLELPITQLLGGNGFTEWLLADSTRAVSYPGIFQYNLASKFPLLLLTILSGWLIYKLVLRETEKESSALLSAGVWLFNPITLYSVVAMGQNDIIAISLFLTGMWFYPKKPVLAFLIFGLSGSIKSYPLIWAGILAMLFPTKSLIKKIWLGGLSVLVYAITIAPFLFSQFFREQVLASGLVTRFFVSGIDLGFGRTVLIVPLLVTLLLIVALLSDSYSNLITSSYFLLTVSFVVLGFSHFNPQWLLWLMPFWAILFPFAEAHDQARKVNRFLLLLLLFSFLLIIMLFEDAFLSWGIFSPLNPNLLNLPIIRDFLSTRGLDVGLFDNIAHSVLAGISIFLVCLTWNIEQISHWRTKSTEKVSEWFDRLLSQHTPFPIQLFEALFLPLVFMIFLFIVAKSLPVVAKSETIIIGNTLFLPDNEALPFSEKLLVTNDSLYRIEVLFKNPNLKSHDEVGMTIADDQGNLITRSVVSGFNIGDPSYFRVDFPAVAHSAGKYFTVSLTKTKIADGKLAIGFSDVNNQRSLILSQYAKQVGFGHSIHSGLVAFISLVKTQPIVIALPIVSMLLI